MITRDKKRSESGIVYLGTEAAGWLIVFVALVGLTAVAGMASWFVIRLVTVSYLSAVDLIRLLRVIL